MKSLLKRSDLLVMCVDSGRETVRVWQGAGKRVREKRAVQTGSVRRQEIIDAYIQREKTPKLQIGAGENTLPGWLNTDLEPGPADIIPLDALQPFPFESQTFAYVFTEHMIEHITYPGALSMLRECFRVLKPAGRLRVATPNIQQIASLCAPVLTEEQKAYVQWSVDHLGLYARERSEFQNRRPEWDLDPRHIRKAFPNKAEDPACFVVNNFFRSYGHQFLYDPGTLRATLESVGFEQVEQCAVGKSADEMLCAVEAHGDRIGDVNNGFETMVMEAVRPGCGER